MLIPGLPCWPLLLVLTPKCWSAPGLCLWTSALFTLSLSGLLWSHGPLPPPPPFPLGTLLNLSASMLLLSCVMTLGYTVIAPKFISSLNPGTLYPIVYKSSPLGPL